jgi:hypothetical protein
MKEGDWYTQRKPLDLSLIVLETANQSSLIDVAVQKTDSNSILLVFCQ